MSDDPVVSNSRIDSPYKSLFSNANSLLEESKYCHHVINIDKIENKCIIHQKENEKFCLNHLTYLCKSCLEEKAKEHEKCNLKNAEIKCIPSIIDDIFNDFKDFYVDYYQKVEKLIKIYTWIEEKKRAMSFDMLITLINDNAIKEKINEYENNKSFIIEVSNIIFDKYLENMLEVHNFVTGILDETKKHLKLVKANYEEYCNHESLNKTEQSQIFNNFIKNNKILIKIKQEIHNYEYKELATSIMENEIHEVCKIIFNTIIIHLTRLFQKN